MVNYSNVDPACRKCALACEGKKAIGGQSVCEFKDVKLIVIGAHPTDNDQRCQLSMADNPRRPLTPGARLVAPTSGNGNAIGAGEYLRYCFKVLIDGGKFLPAHYRPIEDFTYFTTAVKCNPQVGRIKTTIAPKHLKTCKNEWLVAELDALPEGVPILACSNETVKMLLGPTANLYANRSKIHYYKSHPVVVTSNPADWEKCVMSYVASYDDAMKAALSLISVGGRSKKTTSEVLGYEPWKALPGSPLYFVKQDLMLLVKTISESLL